MELKNSNSRRLSNNLFLVYLFFLNSLSIFEAIILKLSKKKNKNRMDLLY